MAVRLKYIFNYAHDRLLHYTYSNLSFEFMLSGRLDGVSILNQQKEVI